MLSRSPPIQGRWTLGSGLTDQIRRGQATTKWPCRGMTESCPVDRLPRAMPCATGGGRSRRWSPSR